MVSWDSDALLIPATAYAQTLAAMRQLRQVGQLTSDVFTKMALTSDLNFQQLETWIGDNAVDNIVPVDANVKNVPTDKGIYFWFMRTECYNILSQRLEDTPLVAVDPCVTKDGLHLVYIGTAGTGKQGGANLRQRLDWHVCQDHLEGCIRHGTLSTLRTGIGSLLSDDLIQCDPTTTRQKINDLFSEYFKVYWKCYVPPNDNEIDNDEAVLIDKIRPIFNIKKNPNSRIDNSPTKIYKLRRKLILSRTKYRVRNNI